MNLEKLNQSITLLANLGVLAGIIFLAIEIQQNTEITQSQVRSEISRNRFDFYQNLTDPIKAEILIQTLRGEVELGPTKEWVAYANIVYSELSMWENEYYQYKKGLFEEEEFLPRLGLWRTRLNSSSYRSVWEGSSGNQYSPEFADLLNGFLEEQIR